MIVSDGHTWPAFVARVKTVTRRLWLPKTAAKFRAGFVFDKWDKSPRCRGKPIGRCRMLEDARLEPLADMPDDDYRAEGFAWMHEHPWTIPWSARKAIWAQGDCSFEAFDAWRRGGGSMWVVRYEILSIDPAAKGRLKELLSERPATARRPKR